MGKDFLGRRSTIAALALAAMLVAAPTALANTYRPDKLSDSPSGGLSLREAVIKANGHPGADKIVLQAGKTYKLSTLGTEVEGDFDPHQPPTPLVRDLDIADPTGSGLTIVSSGDRLATVDAQRIDRVFECWSACKFVRLRIRGGNNTVDGEDGGGINSEGGRISLKLSRVVGNVANQSGGGIAADLGALSISRSVISGNYAGSSGGAIETGEGSVSISKSTIQKNVAALGGGAITSNQPIAIKNSTISLNRSLDSGGGGISHGFDPLTIVNSTIANNAAFGASGTGGGLDVGGGTVVALNAVTIARNSSSVAGGGLQASGGSIFPRNSIIALNSAPVSPDCESLGATLVSFGQNLIGNNIGCPGFSAASGDFVNLSSSAIGLKTLKSNGGPTKTIALKRSSEAVNNAGSDAPNRDQRGVKRTNPDIGAFELR